MTDNGSGTSDVLVVEDLACEFDTPLGPIRPVDNVSFSLQQGKTLGIVGESGAGKSMLARALMGLAPRNATVSGAVKLNGLDISQLPKKEHRALLGAGIALIFQDSSTSLNPVVPIGRQITEGMRFHKGTPRNEARERAIELLNQVGISDPVERLKHYPHQLSGGMRQRVTIAVALACDPLVLIADEATTALDVTVQKQILDLLQKVQEEHHMAMMIITHDLGVVAGRTDEMAVMYAGQIVERGPTHELIRAHRHRYTAALLSSTPTLELKPHTQLATIPGIPPRLAELPPGCRFAPRCPAATPECEAAAPTLVEDSIGHDYRCLWPVRDSDTDSLVEGASAPGGVS